MPLTDEAFVRQWQKANGQEVLHFLKAAFLLPITNWHWENLPAMTLDFIQTLGGKLPVITTSSHQDFRQMYALLNGKNTLRELPPTVNAFTMQLLLPQCFHHRILLLNRAFYSNISATQMGLTTEEWLIRSQRLRLRHECAHYETLRLLGGMRNHPLDEIIADTLGQIAAFGNFSADRQRLFFGLDAAKNTCHGRLTFYCQKLNPEEQQEVYRAVNKTLDRIEPEINGILRHKATNQEIFTGLARLRLTP